MKKNAFGMIEVLIAMGLLGIVAAGFTSIITNSMKSQRDIQAKDQQREFTSELRTLLSDKYACYNSLGGYDPTAVGGFTVNKILDAAGVERYRLNDNDKTGFLNFQKFEVSNLVFDVSNPQHGKVDLKVYLRKVWDVASVRDIHPDTINLRVKLDASQHITECFAIGNNAYGFWLASPGDPSNIFYGGGNVGVGTTNPSAKLDVAGEVKFGNTSSTCNATNEGQQRYNSASKNMEFCNGTTWTAYGTGGSGGRTTCPIGFTLIGTSGSAEAFCISSNQESPSSWEGGASVCYNKSLSARLCSASEWAMACVAGASGPNNMTGHWELVGDRDSIISGSSGAVIMGMSSCGHSSADGSGSIGFRCCFR